MAAAWVAQQVSRVAVVSCDRVTCSALAAHGFPAGNLHELVSKASNPLGSDLVVATADVRNEFGTRLSSVYAPEVIASFGSGNARIDIRVVAADGAAAYRSQLKTDLQARKAAGAQLLGPRIVASATARRELIAGQVDTRLLILISALAAQSPVNIVAFGDSAPGAAAGTPLRSVDLAETGGGVRAISPGNVPSILAFLRAQRPPYLPTHAGTTRLAGHPVLFIAFSAPSPLGLISPENP